MQGLYWHPKFPSAVRQMKNHSRAGQTATFRSVFGFAMAVVLVTVPSQVVADAPGKPYEQQQDVVIVQSPHGVVITMDVFTPKENANGIGIIDVASGGWSSDRGKIRDHEMAQVYNIFCQRGYTMFAIRPGSSSRFSAHDMVDHLESAIKEIQKNADKYGIDPDRMAITGASAGGHLASLVAVRGKVPLVGAGVFFPPTDFLEYGKMKIDPTKKGRISEAARALAYKDRSADLNEEQIIEQLTAISPARQVTADAPPFMIIHGDADLVVPLQQSERLLAELKDKGVAAELIVKAGGGHPWLTINEEVAKMADWFDKLYASSAAESTAP
jgi:acetyl esterase/lipase